MEEAVPAASETSGDYEDESGGRKDQQGSNG